MSEFYPIIDAHCHVFPDLVAVKSKSTVSEFYDLPMYTSGTVQNLQKERSRVISFSGTDYKITRQLISSPAVTANQTASINRFIANLVQQDDAFIGFGTLHPGNTNYAEILRSFRQKGLVGLKLHSDFQQFNIDDPDMYPVYAEAEKLGIPVLFHMGDRKLDFSHPRRLQTVLQCFPNLIVIAAHMGGYSHWSEAFDLLQPSGRLYFDLSSTLQFIDGDLLRKFLDKFGEEQFFFGSDFPMWDPEKELERLLSFQLAESTLQNILYDNFLRYIEKRA